MVSERKIGKKQLKIARQEFTIATWNVRNWYEEGKMNELEYELQKDKRNVLGIAEMRWLKTGEISTEEGNKLWWSGNETRHEGGVGFM